MRKIIIALGSLTLLLTSCQTMKETTYTYVEPEKQGDWYMSNGATVGKENDYSVYVLKGKDDIFANFRQKKSDFVFSGELRFESLVGTDNWIAVQWGVPEINNVAGQNGGYYLLFDKASSTCHFFKGPWNQEAKTKYDSRIETIGNRYVKFRIEKAGSKMTIYIDDNKMYEFSDESFLEGYVGLYAWSKQGLTALYRNVSVQ